MALNLIARSLFQATCPTNGFTSVAATVAGPLNMINYVQNRGAARRGKRIQRAREARLRANKRRLAEAQNPKPKKRPIGQLKIDKAQFRFQDERQRDLTMPELPSDNVYFVEKFRKKRFSLEEILELHRQVCHPDILDKPDTLVTAVIELNLKMKIKKAKYIERINSTVCYPHTFKYEIRPRKIVALCKDEVKCAEARKAGAILAGGMNVVDQLKKGLLTQRDFDHLVCHNDILVDFAAVKGMKNATYFPTRARGNFGDNLAELVRYFKDGIDYSLKVDPGEPEFGFIECYFGKLDMSNEQLSENLTTLFNSINRFKPMNLEDNKQFFERVSITTVANPESFFLKFWDIIDEYYDPSNPPVEEEEDETSAKQSSNAA